MQKCRRPSYWWSSRNHERATPLPQICRISCLVRDVPPDQLEVCFSPFLPSYTLAEVNGSGTVFYPRDRLNDDLKKRGEKLKKFVLTTAQSHLSAASKKRATISHPPADYVVDEDLCQAAMEAMQFRFDSIRRFEDPMRCVI